MADVGSGQSEALWPLPTFRFEVRWDSMLGYFQEVTGLDSGSEAIEYRRADLPPFAVVKMPELKKYGDVTLKKGVFPGDDKFWDWFKAIETDSVERKRITVSLLDASDTPTMVWTLANAWPTKVIGTDLKSQGNEVAVEAIVIAYEGLTIAIA